jgi:hypothetical protein
MNKKAFTQSEFGNGFTILFANKWSVSVQWSEHHKCDGGIRTAEVAVLDPDGMFWTIVDDELKLTGDVMPYTTSEELVNIINKVS